MGKHQNAKRELLVHFIQITKMYYKYICLSIVEIHLQHDF